MRSSPTDSPTIPIAGAERGLGFAFALVALLVVAGLGALNLHYPFVHDQLAVFYAAKSIANGGILYVNYWDNKLPGLVWFYLLAGKGFGFSELGVHKLELIWMLSFASALIVLSWRQFQIPWAACAVPVAAVGTYYVAADPFQLTQIEFVSALPIFLSMWASTQIKHSTHVRMLCFFVAGLCAGVTVTFKLVYAPIFVVFWLIASAYACGAHQLTVTRVITSMLMPASFGVALVLIAVAGKFWMDGALQELLWTAFVYPPAALGKAPPAPLMRLLESFLYFASFFAVWAVFAVIAVIDWWYAHRDLFFALVMAWLITAVGLILIQRFSWWQYHFMLLFTPMALLGVRGCVALPARLLLREQLNRAQCLCLVAVLLFAPLAGLAVPAMQKVHAHIQIFLVQKDGPDKLKDLANGEYITVRNSVRFLNIDTARPGRIYVFGNPLYYLLSGRDPALPIIGWPWQYFLDEQWLQIPRQLKAAKPPYIYVDHTNRDMMEKRGGGVLDFLLANYVPLGKDVDGVWYQIKPELLTH